LKTYTVTNLHIMCT